MRQCAFGPFKRGLLFGRFLRNFPWSPVCTFSENAAFGWPYKNCHTLAIRAFLEPLFAPKSFLVFAVYVHTNCRIIPFAPECFWAFQMRAFFWTLCTFSENAGFGWPCLNCHNLTIRALLEPLVCLKIFSSLCSLSAYKLENNAICARVLLGLSNEGYFLGDFWKISLGPPFCPFPENSGFGWPCNNCHNLPIGTLLEPLFSAKYSPVCAL